MSSRKTWIGSAAILLAALLLFITATTMMKLMPAKAASTSQPVQVFTFPDGAKLEVLGTCIGTYVEDFPNKNPWPSFTMRKGARTTGMGGFNIHTEEENGKITRLTFTPESSSTSLLMAIRFRDRYGYLQSASFLSVDASAYFPVITPGSSRRNDFLQLKDATTETLIAEMNRLHLDLVIQYRDASGTWHPLAGPCPYQGKLGPTCMLALSAWDRGNPTMDFRAVRAGGQILEFSLKNPDVRKASTTIVPVSLPHVHKGADFELTFQSVQRVPAGDGSSNIKVETSIENHGKSIRCTLAGAEDEWGNTSQGIATLPDSSLKMRARYKVIRDINFPRHDTSGFSLAEGTVTPDGKQVEFTLLPDGKRFGCTPIPTLDLRPASKSSFRKFFDKNLYKDWREIELPMELRVTSKTASEAFEKRIGEIYKCHFLIFPEGSRESAGYSSGERGGSSGSNKGLIEKTDTHLWLLSPEMVKPGARLRIGVHPSIPDEYFTVDLPTH